MSDSSAQEAKPVVLHFGVSLFIKGDGLSIDEVSRTLGLTPSSVSRKGERYGHAQTLCDFDAWFYMPSVAGERPLAEHIRALRDAVRPHTRYLRELRQKFQVSISVHVSSSSAWFGKEYHTRFQADVQSLELCTELGIPLEFLVTIKERLV